MKPDRPAYLELVEVAEALARVVGDLDNPHVPKWKVVPGRVLNMLDDIHRAAAGVPMTGDWKRSTENSHEFHMVGNIEGCKHCYRMRSMLELEGRLYLDCPGRRATGPQPTAWAVEQVYDFACSTGLEDALGEDVTELALRFDAIRENRR